MLLWNLKPKMEKVGMPVTPRAPPVSPVRLVIRILTISENPMVVSARYTPDTRREGYPSPIPMRHPMPTAATRQIQGFSPSLVASSEDV